MGSTSITGLARTSTCTEYCEENLYLGVPSANIFYFCRQSYAFGFDIQRKIPLWVVYPVTSDMSNETTEDQKPSWRQDTEIPMDLQRRQRDFNKDSFHRVQLIDLKNTEDHPLESRLYTVCLPIHQALSLGDWPALNNLTFSAPLILIKYM